ncbi:MAG: tRNA (adenosine(37)-N6)-dimethylallyltransferase MiaA [Muribaculaceae bacterium]|nr:tRNA (adenosine(37)-N6)-dimethylallyltransferase MiaA [Muribaculaceae bacterium]
MKQPTMLVITGPTASGKSALAVEVASRLGAEIISADSRQIYTGIPIVTAMPTPEERSRVHHHLIDMLPLDSYYSAAKFEEDALSIAGPLMQRDGSAVVCGGSMLYVDALCNGIDPLPTVPDDVREGVRRQLNQLGTEWLLAELELLDPEYFKIVDRNNLKRVIHAVEIIRTAGRPLSELQSGLTQSRDFKIVKILVEAPREELFNRINTRVDAMMDAGLEEEAAGVAHLRHLNSLNTVGLKEMFAMFDGLMTRTEAVERIKKNTRVYAKKQITWWKKRDDMVRVERDSADWQRLISNPESFL